MLLFFPVVTAVTYTTECYADNPEKATATHKARLVSK